MSLRENKDDSHIDSSKEEEFACLEEFAQTVVGTFKETYKDVNDPFEYYVYSVRSHIYSSNPTYPARFAAGYQILCDTLSAND